MPGKEYMFDRPLPKISFFLIRMLLMCEESNSNLPITRVNLMLAIVLWNLYPEIIILS